MTPEGVELLHRLKGRDESKPFLVLLPELDEASASGLSLTHVARGLAQRHWPGPLTLILRDPEGRYPNGVRSRGGGVAVRLSSHPFVQAFMRAFGKPLISTSANVSGGEPARTVDDMKRAARGRPGFLRLWLIDGGNLIPSSPSTIVDCTGPEARVVRRGTLPLEDLRAPEGDAEDGQISGGPGRRTRDAQR